MVDTALCSEHAKILIESLRKIQSGDKRKRRGREKKVQKEVTTKSMEVSGF